MTTTSFVADTYNRIKEAVLHIDEKQASDVYALSFFKNNADDDPRAPMLIVGYNTLSQWKASTPVDGQEIKWPIASDANEAKWNYAFWLQNEELVIGGYEYDPVRDWVKQLPFYYTDEQQEEDFDNTYRLGAQIQKQFMDIMIAHAKRLHDEGLSEQGLERTFPLSFTNWNITMCR